jgi:hypothetical protein
LSPGNTPRSTTPRRSPTTTFWPRSARVGDAYDNALAESFVDSFKTELVADRVWQTRSQLELAVVEYIGWFNSECLHESLGDVPPAEFEALYAEQERTKISASGAARAPPVRAMQIPSRIACSRLTHRLSRPNLRTAEKPAGQR